MEMYEVELRRPGKPREVRLGDRPLTPGETLTIENELWRVLRRQARKHPRRGTLHLLATAPGVAPRLVELGLGLH